MLEPRGPAGSPSNIASFSVLKRASEMTFWINSRTECSCILARSHYYLNSKGAAKAYLLLFRIIGKNYSSSWEFGRATQTVDPRKIVVVKEACTLPDPHGHFAIVRVAV
eukprot:157701-Hanusia_phi.AAC.1